MGLEVTGMGGEGFQCPYPCRPLVDTFDGELFTFTSFLSFRWSDGFFLFCLLSPCYVMMLKTFLLISWEHFLRAVEHCISVFYGHFSWMLVVTHWHFLWSGERNLLNHNLKNPSAVAMEYNTGVRLYCRSCSRSSCLSACWDLTRSWGATLAWFLYLITLFLLDFRTAFLFLLASVFNLSFLIGSKKSFHFSSLVSMNISITCLPMTSAFITSCSISLYTNDMMITVYHFQRWKVSGNSSTCFVCFMNFSLCPTSVGPRSLWLAVKSSTAMPARHTVAFRYFVFSCVVLVHLWYAQ